VILGLAVGQQLNPKNGERADKENMNVPALMQKELKNEPDYEKYCTKNPHPRDTLSDQPAIKPIAISSGVSVDERPTGLHLVYSRRRER
jgi:hypothetical protein